MVFQAACAAYWTVHAAWGKCRWLILRLARKDTFPPAKTFFPPQILVREAELRASAYQREEHAADIARLEEELAALRAGSSGQALRERAALAAEWAQKEAAWCVERAAVEAQQEWWATQLREKAEWEVAHAEFEARAALREDDAVRSRVEGLEAELAGWRAKSEGWQATKAGHLAREEALADELASERASVDEWRRKEEESVAEWRRKEAAWRDEQDVMTTELAHAGELVAELQAVAEASARAAQREQAEALRQEAERRSEVDGDAQRRALSDKAQRSVELESKLQAALARVKVDCPKTHLRNLQSFLL